MKSFHSRVAEDCSDASRAAAELADLLFELGQSSAAQLANTIAEKMARLSYDALIETQPIELSAFRKRQTGDDGG